MTKEEAIETLVGVESDYTSELFNLPDEWADKFEKFSDLEEQIEELQGHMNCLGSCDSIEDAFANANLALATISKMPKFAQRDLKSLKNDLKEAIEEVKDAGYGAQPPGRSGGISTRSALAALDVAAGLLRRSHPHWVDPKLNVETMLAQAKLQRAVKPRTMSAFDVAEALARAGLLEKNAEGRFVETSLARSLPVTQISAAAMRGARDVIEDVGYAAGNKRR